MLQQLAVLARGEDGVELSQAIALEARLKPRVIRLADALTNRHAPQACT
jgi:hypothetical protein